MGGVRQTFTQVEKNFFYEDPQFLGRRLVANWGVVEGGEAKTYYAGLAKPFHATTAQESLGFSGSYRDERIFHDDAIISFGRVRQRTKEGRVFYGRSLGSTPSMVRRGVFTVGYSRSRREAIPGESVIKSDPLEVNTTLEALFTSEEQAFVKEKNIRRLYRDEDINPVTGVMSICSRRSGPPRTAIPMFELGKSFGPGTSSRADGRGDAFGDYFTSVVWNPTLSITRGWLIKHPGGPLHLRLRPPVNPSTACCSAS